MGRSIRLCGALTALGAGVLTGAAARAQEAGETIGIAHDWQFGFQPPGSPVMAQIEWFHNWLLLPIITAIVLLVLGLLLFIMVRFNARTNPTPSRTTHNTTVELVWTIVPVIVLVVIAVPSFRLLYLQRDFPEAGMTIKATGHQWYWTYDYPDNGELSFDAVMLTDEERAPGQPRLLAADNPLVVPQGTTVRIIVTASDVIHSWAMPAFGVKIDAIPGRLNEAWFRADTPGIYYGQCSELCGNRHAFMPIELHVVSQEGFETWLADAQARFASGAQPPRQVTTAARVALAPPAPGQ